MKTVKRTEITVEQQQIWVIRQGQTARKASSAWCETCSAAVTMVAAELAATLAGVNTRALYRLVEDGQLHFTETPEGQLLICFNSLLLPDAEVAPGTVASDDSIALAKMEQPEA